MSNLTYNTLIRSSGTSTATTGEATTSLGSNEYQITDTAKQTWDRQVAPTVYVASSIVTTGYTVDYLFGIIKFDSSQTGAVTVDCNYLPMTEIVGGTNYNLELTADVLDTTDIAFARNNSGYRRHSTGFIGATLSIDRLYDLDSQYRNGLLNGQSYLVEIRPNTSTVTIRGWFIVESAGLSGDISSLEMENLNFHLNGDVNSAFSWRD